MAIEILVVIFIGALMVYIVYLHVQLTKKNIFIESTVKKLTGIENNLSIDEMMVYLQEIQNISQYRSLFKDKYLDNKTVNFILEDNKDLKIYIHYTKEKSVAESILKNGFMFSDPFYKTALSVSKDKLDMKIKHYSRKLFGDYLIIICISNDISNFYSMELKKAHVRNCSFENILTEIPPFQNESSDLIYQLAPQFVKGYIYLPTGEIFKNPWFDPNYNSANFKKNIELIITNKFQVR